MSVIDKSLPLHEVSISHSFLRQKNDVSVVLCFETKWFLSELITETGKISLQAVSCPPRNLPMSPGWSAAPQGPGQVTRIKRRLTHRPTHRPTDPPTTLLPPHTHAHFAFRANYPALSKRKALTQPPSQVTLHTACVTLPLPLPLTCEILHLFFHHPKIHSKHQKHQHSSFNSFQLLPYCFAASIQSQSWQQPTQFLSSRCYSRSILAWMRWISSALLRS